MKGEHLMKTITKSKSKRHSRAFLPSIVCVGAVAAFRLRSALLRQHNLRRLVLICDARAWITHRRRPSLAEAPMHTSTAKGMRVTEEGFEQIKLAEIWLQNLF